jgi:hypothetical protein
MKGEKTMPAPPGPGQLGYVPPNPGVPPDIAKRLQDEAARRRYDPESRRHALKVGIFGRSVLIWYLLVPCVLFAAATVYAVATAHVGNAVFAGAVTAVLFLLILRSARRIKENKERLRDIR